MNSRGAVALGLTAAAGYFKAQERGVRSFARLFRERCRSSITMPTHFASRDNIIQDYLSRLDRLLQQRLVLLDSVLLLRAKIANYVVIGTCKLIHRLPILECR